MARKEAIDWIMSPARSISSVLMEICQKGKKDQAESRSFYQVGMGKL